MTRFTSPSRWLNVAVTVIACATAFETFAGDKCTSTPISLQEAYTLLSASPELVSATKRGRIPAPMAWEPPGSDNSRFFYFEVRTVNSPDADGGLIGFFAISKSTARVFDISGEDTLLSGAELDAATQALRKRHCITAVALSNSSEERPTE